MNKKYCLIPDEEKFYSFLALLTFSPVELMQLKLMHINQICVDESACQWEVHFSCAAHLTGGLLQKAAQQLAAAFSLQSVGRGRDYRLHRRAVAGGNSSAAGAA